MRSSLAAQLTATGIFFLTFAVIVMDWAHAAIAGDGTNEQN
jgi:hypothetical protein